MHIIPLFPEFKALSTEMRGELSPVLELLADGVSEFTFANLYLHRDKYSYELSRTQDGVFIARGERPGLKFFFALNGVPQKAELDELFEQNRGWKLIPASVVAEQGEKLALWGIKLEEDRNNSDYLYLRADLAELRGKNFHKKKNLVNAFKKAYEIEVKQLDEATKNDAIAVLESWNEGRLEITDYKPAREALEKITELGLSGWIVYVAGNAVGWSLGEKLGDSMFCVHFEKGLEKFKGVYQFVNNITAINLDESIMYINREQDLGDEGLRQAKMTYRPCGFVVKYTALRP